jgi:hypothetical protein
MMASLFRGADTPEDFQAAEAEWKALKPEISRYEKSLDCENYGTEGDKQIAKAVVDDLVKKPVGLIIAVCEFVLSLAGEEDKEAARALKECVKALREEAEKMGKEWAVDKVKESLGSGKTLEQVISRAKESLLRYLQSKSRRSRKYFLKIIEDIVGLAKGIGGIALKAGEILVTPSGITPEWCGVDKDVEEERTAAISRIFAPDDPSPNQLP